MHIKPVQSKIDTIYLAGGCFWGVEGYFSKLLGIISTKVGYANGYIENPTYDQVCHEKTGYAETVAVEFDSVIISLEEIILHFFRIINPYTLHQQGNDIGEQYRSGIYFTDKEQEKRIKKVVKLLDTENRFVVEIKELENFYLAEEYHQKYLLKNPQGYCHINLNLASEPLVVPRELPGDEDTLSLKKRIGDLAYKVTQEAGTEPAFTGQYDKEFAPGIYVDIVDGTPLFVSSDKFNSGCGWPAFSRPITSNVLSYKMDYSLNRERVEVRSQHASSHLGHVFPDGPIESGGLRYCINSAAIRFIPLDKMEEEGYGDYIFLVRESIT